MFSVKVKVFTAPSVPLVGDSSRRKVLNPFPNPRPFKRARDVTALQCSEPLRYKVGGPSKPSPCCAGWDCLVVGLFKTDYYE